MPDDSAPLGASPAAPAGAPFAPPPAPKKFNPRVLISILVFILIAAGLPALVFHLLHVFFHFKLKIENLALPTVLPIEGTLAISVLLATFFASRIARKSLDEVGLPPRQALGLLFWEGVLWGFVMLSALLLILHIGGDFRISGLALPHAAILKYALAWGVAFLCVGIYEECLFRGYFLFSLSRRLTFWPSALIMSLLFAAAHLGNSGENFFGILQVFVIGMVLCLIIRRTGSLWFGIGLHASWDWAQTFFYGTPDSGLLGVGHLLNSASAGSKWVSGGSAGPEGSVFSLLVILLAAAFIHLRFPKALYPNKPV
ncbi:MAG TPA: type II CAAX endopeptidase family protein [Verrucomicrobiae bacterium]|nr:type II CAAX endopeptidase family protein [Verrucomicrobiae bacterium]